MKEIRATVIKVLYRTDNVISCWFRPDEKLEFVPGQFAQVIFDEQDRNNKTLNKYLSFSSRPGKDYFEVTKKLSGSDFSIRLKALKANARVLFKAPLGNCALDEKEEKIGFLIGGIGITPVISILEQIVDKNLPTDALLLYSNWTCRDIAFKPELDAWSSQNKNIRVVHVLVNCTDNDQGCFAGMITPEVIQQQMPDCRERQMFIFGPPGMVAAMQDACQQLGCAKERIKAENFVGY